MKKREPQKQTGRVNYIWVLAGGYLLYLAVQLVRQIIAETAGTPVASALAAAVFAGMGVWLMAREWRAYRYAKAHVDDPESWSDEDAEAPEELEALEEPDEEPDGPESGSGGGTGR